MQVPAGVARAASGKVWSGLSGPPLSPSAMPRTNVVTYWVTSGAPPSSTESTLTVILVPVEPTRTLNGDDVVTMVRPGTSGW